MAYSIRPIKKNFILMKKFVSFFFFFLLSASFLVKGQNSILLVGKVFDEQKNTLPGATIYSYNARKGTTTDKSGFFKMVISNPDSLRISFIGYKTQTIAFTFIDPVNAADTLINLNIYLQRSSVSLREAVVSAKKKPELLYGFDGKINQWVYDYETQDDKIWLLIQRGNRRTLAIINQSGDTLFTRQLYFKPNSIVKDAYGTIILLSNEKAYLASYEIPVNSVTKQTEDEQGNSISQPNKQSDPYGKRIFKIYREFLLKEYEALIKPVVAGNKDYYFFRTNDTLAGSLSYFQYSLKGEKTVADSLFYFYSAVNQLANIAEENRRIRLNTVFGSNERKDLVAFNANRTNQFVAPTMVIARRTREEMPDVFDELIDREIIQELDPKSRREVREFNALFTDFKVSAAFTLPSSFNPEVTGWFAKLLMKEKFCPLFLHQDTVIVFNHEIDSLHLFHLNGERLHTSYIAYKVKDAKQEEILPDKETGKFYYKYVSNGLIHLREIDVMTGSAVRNFVIEEMTFPDKIQVNDDAVFFLHKTKNEPGKRLYRLPLN
jgi:hypothetical protein